MVPLSMRRSILSEHQDVSDFVVSVAVSNCEKGKENYSNLAAAENRHNFSTLGL